MRIVIVGGGFAGVKSALELASKGFSDITLISDTPYFLHHATLYSTATGHDDGESVLYLKDLFSRFPSVKIVLDSMHSLNVSKKIVTCKYSSHNYDKLVIAIGAVTSYFSISGAKSHVLGIKSLQEVKHFRNHIERSVNDKSLKKSSFFIIGGGQTGVELAASLGYFVKLIAKKNNQKAPNFQISIVEAADRLLPRMSSTASKFVTKRLKKMGIRVMVNKKVSEISKDFIKLDDKLIPTHTVVWTSGVMNHPFFSKYPQVFKLNKSGRVIVDKNLLAYKDIFVIGDNNDVLYSGTAWSAFYQGEYIAKYLDTTAKKRSKLSFQPRKSPVGLPVGPNWGYVEWYGLYLKGYSGYIARRIIELYGYLKLAKISVSIHAWRLHSIYNKKYINK